MLNGVQHNIDKVPTIGSDALHDNYKPGKDKVYFRVLQPGGIFVGLRGNSAESPRGSVQASFVRVPVPSMHPLHFK